MSNTNNHPWSRDPVAQAAVRAAEDDAAQWRRLEVGEVIKAGDEFYSPSRGAWFPTEEAGEKLTSSAAWQLMYRRRRVPLPDHRELPQAVAELRERVAKIEEAMVSGSTWFPKSDQPAPTPPPAPPQITEGDTLATVRDGGGRPMPKGPPPGLRAGKREAAPASRDAVNAPLYAAPVAESATTPQPPRGWLNSEERRTLENFVTGLRTAAMAPFNGEATRWILTKQANDVEALLARSTPPKVKMPPAAQGETPLVRDLMWGQAIRAAGGEVE